MRRPISILAGVFLAVMLLSAATASAQVPADTGGDDHPVLVDAPWAGAAVIGIAGFFLAGLVIGPAVRLHAPPTHAHDEPPGTSGHHGRTGTVQPKSP